jgi:hypothetical protein
LKVIELMINKKAPGAGAFFVYAFAISGIASVR